MEFLCDAIPDVHDEETDFQIMEMDVDEIRCVSEGNDYLASLEKL